MLHKRVVTLMSPDIGANLMIRAFELKLLLEEDFHVRIAGPSRRGGLWSPLAELTDLDVRTFEVRTLAHLARRAASISREVLDGDLLIALGARPASYGLGLAAGRVLGRPLLLDNHEWEIGFLGPSWLRDLARRPFPGRLLSLRSPLCVRLLDLKVRRCEPMLVTNRFLQRRYGGYWIPHVRDGAVFRPRRRRGECPAGAGEVMFLGTGAPTKGLADLLAAWRGVDRPRARLRIVGPISPEDRAELMALADARVTFEDAVSISRVPELLGQSDVIAIPQREDVSSIGLLPSRLVEAMAMGKAIVATDVGDAAPFLAEGAGVVVPERRPERLASALLELLDDPDRVTRLGERARERFLRFASVEAQRPQLVDLVRRMIDGRSLPPTRPAFEVAT